MKRCFSCMEEILGEQELCPQCGQHIKTEKKESYHITPGTWLFDRYLVGISTGYHGDSIIYIGYDKILQQVVSIKEYFPLEYAVREADGVNVSLYVEEFDNVYREGISGFIGEAKSLARFRDNEGITKILDVFEQNNTAYQIIEYVRGEKLTDIINERGRLAVDRTIDLLEPVALSLKKVHEAGLIHRNISPDTIIISKDGNARLIDFGAVRRTSANATRSLSVVIDPGFTPTEQYMSTGNQGAWTDVYAFAATIYKCITGITPEESIIRSKEDSLKYPSEYGVKISTNIENALMHALSIDVTERTLTIDDFLDEIHSKESDIKKRLILNRWHIYGILCISLWVFSITVSYNLINSARRAEVDKTEFDNIHEKESVVENYINKTDDIDNANVTIEKTQKVITTHESYTTRNTEAEKITEAGSTDEKKTVNTVTQKTTEKKTTEKKTEDKKTTEKKTSVKKNNKKKTTEKATTERKTEVSTTEADDTEEMIYIED